MGKSTKFAIEHQSPFKGKTFSEHTSQGKRFIETAREIGCDENEAEFMRKLGKIVRVKPSKDDPKK